MKKCPDANHRPHPIRPPQHSKSADWPTKYRNIDQPYTRLDFNQRDFEWSIAP